MFVDSVIFTLGFLDSILCRILCNDVLQFFGFINMDMDSAKEHLNCKMLYMI